VVCIAIAVGLNAPYAMRCNAGSAVLMDVTWDADPVKKASVFRSFTLFFSQIDLGVECLVS
jgi:hypothetical protein